MMSTKDRLRTELSSVRTWWTDKFLHRFLAAGFQFPSLYAPDSFLHLPICQNIDPMPPIISGPSPAVKRITHFSRPLVVSSPLLTAAALLSWMVRQELVRAAEPWVFNAFSGLPPTHTAAIALNHQGPTLEDVLAYREQRVASPQPLPLHPGTRSTM
ncbi:hypothetical protein BDZ89DRAFT_378704 [Hymenopellis radicata]|nr:hypothetical protein BDZ89DRAFT_378704 [Hymenopellis radicata]